MTLNSIFAKGLSMKRLALLVVLLLPLTASAKEKPRPMKVDDLFRFKRISEAQISPDGKWVVYTQANVNLEANKSVSHLWLASTDKGGVIKQLTAAAKSDRHPRWSPDGKSILFESSRSGSNQLWIIDIDGGEARQLTRLSTEAATGIWSR